LTTIDNVRLSMHDVFEVVRREKRARMNNEPELRQLRTFLVVAEELHFTRAAERLNLAQQALSSQVRSLEQRLGVSLFDRTTRRVELTEAGRTLLAHAVPLLASATRAWDAVASASAGETAHITVSYAPTARHEILPAILEEVHRRHPQLEVTTCELWGGGNAVQSGMVDVAIMRGDVPDVVGITGTKVQDSPFGVILSADHPLAGQSSIEVADLGDTPVELPTRVFNQSFHDAVLAALGARGYEGKALEFENFASNFLLGDDGAQRRIRAGDSFGISFYGQYDSLPAEFVLVPVLPSLHLPMNMCWHESAGAGVINFTQVALSVAHQQHWLDGPTTAVTA
jgi:DNA-binding transcriptional LysR family regulator